MPSLHRASLCLALGCVPPVPADRETEPPPERGESGLIIGSVDWQEVTSLDPASAERARSLAVGYLSIPSAGSRCTAFLVADGVAMTNNHCVSSASDASGASISFRRELGVPASEWATYDCSAFIGTDASLDFTLLGCAGRPGQAQGVVALDEGPMASGDPIYVIHQNCDYYTAPSCAPNKKHSAGAITYAGATSLRHDADTLGGSSGSPIFSAAHDRVIGLHNSGYGNDGNGRGTENGGVPMAAIAAAIRARFPTALAPAAPAGDPLEPNDAAGSATPAGDGYARSDLGIHAGDHDVFRIELHSMGTIGIGIDFVHASGDVDAKLYAGSIAGTPIVTADSADDDERIDTSAGSGTYYLDVYGYNSAVNAYGITFSIVEAPPAPAPPASRDAYEPNDTMATAAPVATPFAFDGRIQSGEEDYFSFTGDGTSRSIRLDFSHAAGDLDLFVYDGAGARVAASDGTTDRELIERAFAPGSYSVRAVGYAGATGDYHLSIE